VKLNLYDPAFTSAPHEVWASLRAECPVAHSEEHGGFWILTRYDDIVGAAQDPGMFSSVSVTIPSDLGGEAVAEHPPITWDPPRHIEYRRLILPLFSSRKINDWRPTMERLAREAIASFISKGRCDAALDFARAIPVGVMCPLLGVPTSMESQFRIWGEAINASSDMAGAEVAATELDNYFGSLVVDRHKHPQNDLITLLTKAEVQGQPLRIEEMTGGLAFLLIAGLDTVWNVLSNSILHLATTPADRVRLVDEPELIPLAVEEFLRCFAPASPARITTSAVTIGGARIGQGDSVMLALPSGNRDAGAFDEPDTVCLGRKPNRHLAFGVGPHRCVGAPLARLELEVALTEWLAAIPDFEVADDAVIEYAPGQVWGPHSVPVVFSAGEGRRR
jgi:cytochrome P450